MNRSLVIAALVTVAAPFPGWPQAQTAPRAWVSGHGTDVAGCGAPTAPCRSFQYAHDHIVAAGGEIDVLDPSGYGAVSITKAISIINDGVGVAGVQATGGNGITINAGASDVISLRGLTIAGTGGGVEGVFMTGGGVLNVQNCVVRGFSSDGFELQPPGTAVINVLDTLIANNANNAIGIEPSGSGRVTALLKRVVATGGSDGIIVNGVGSTGTLNVTIDQSAFSDNDSGIVATSFLFNAPTSVLVVRSVVSNSRTVGLHSQGLAADIYLAKSAVSGALTAFTTSANGTIDSFGDNDIIGNGNDGGALPFVAPK